MDCSKTNRKQCAHCGDLGYVLKDNWTAAECPCLDKKRLQARLKGALIPEEFGQATFRNFQVHNQVQKLMLNAAVQYVKDFSLLQQQSANSFGFIAKIGEQTIRSISNDKMKWRMKTSHNGWGIGKTHLQVAMAKALIKQGFHVLIISDAAFLDELMMAKRYEDGKTFTQLLETVIEAPILVWDDIGKANPTEAKKSAYFRIINERYRKQNPIVYSSNEDSSTLADRIGDAAASRLYGMSKNRVYQVEGPDYRVSGTKK